MARDGGGKSAKAVGPGILGLSGEGASQLFGEDLDGDGGELVEHDGGGTAGEVSAAESSGFLGEELSAADGLDDDVQAGQDGVGLGQEVAVAHELVLRNSSELLEHLLVLGVILDEAAHRNFK